MTTAQDVPQIEGPAMPVTRRRWTGPRAFVATAILLLLIVGAAGAVALFRMTDSGARMASAEAMPADTEIYIDVDFRSLGNLDAMLMSFDAAFAAADVEPGLDGLIERIDQELVAAVGIGVDDITPWVGRDLGIGISNISLGAEAPDADFVAALSVRDEEGADAFIDLMIGNLEARDLETFSETTYQGVRLHVSADDPDSQQIVAGRSGDVLLIGNGEDVVHRAIDAQTATSLADDATMEQTLGALPDDRAITVYFRGEALENVFEEITGQLGPAIGAVPEPDFQAGAMSVALTADGVQFDLAELRASTGAEASSSEIAGSSSLPGLLPSTAFAYVGIAGDTPLFGPDVTLDEVLSGAGVSAADLQEIGIQIEELEAQIGFDIEDDLLRHLGGDVGFAVLEAARPLFGDPTAPDIGGLGLVGVTDAAAVANTAELFSSFLADQGVEVSEHETAGSTLYGVGENGAEFLVFGVAGEYLVVASDADDVAALSAEGAKLSDDPFFARATAALPESGDPLFFLDLRRALDALDAPLDAARILEPIEGIVANAHVADAVELMTVIVMVDY